MNELEFLRRCTIDPHDPDEALARKAEERPEYARYLKEQREFDDLLRAAAGDIPAPDGLADRILWRHAKEQRKSRSRIWQGGLAMVASLVLVIGLVWVVQVDRTALDRVVLAHVYGELSHLHEDARPSNDEINRVLAGIGATMTGPLGEVHYAGACDIREHSGAHLVLAGEQGPVTVLLMPGEHVDQAEPVTDKRFQGVIVPTPTGSMAIVGERHEPLERLEGMLRSGIDWHA